MKFQVVKVKHPQILGNKIQKLLKFWGQIPNFKTLGY